MSPKMYNSVKSYPLLPYSQLVFDMMKINPDVYWYRYKLRFDKSMVDMERLKDAFMESLRNHPVASMVVDINGLQYYEPHEDVLHGQYYSVDFLDDAQYLYVDVAYNRILGDAISETVFTEDLFRAYRGLSLSKDYYLEYLKEIETLKQSDRYKENRQWLEAKYGAITCPVRPSTDIPVNVPMTTESFYSENYSGMSDKLQQLANDNLINLTSFFSLCAALSIMDYNGTDEAALTWAYDGRETEMEQRIFGSLHRDVPIFISRKSKDKSQKIKDELLRQVRKETRDGIKHSSYPYTLLEPQNVIWNNAVNVLFQPAINSLKQNAPMRLDIIMPNTDKPAYSLLDVEIYDEEQLTINYRYSTTHYKPESIKCFAGLVRENAEWLLSVEK